MAKFNKNGHKIGYRRKRLGLKDRIFPKESNFYKMLVDQASKTLEGIEALETFVGDQNQENANRVKDY